MVAAKGAAKGAAKASSAGAGGSGKFLSALEDKATDKLSGLGGGGGGNRVTQSTRSVIDKVPGGLIVVVLGLMLIYLGVTGQLNCIGVCFSCMFGKKFDGKLEPPKGPGRGIVGNLLGGGSDGVTVGRRAR